MFKGKYRNTKLARMRANDLRRRQNKVEKILWHKIRAHRFHGYKFRRQVPIGIYIVDFLCAEKNLIIELDGDSHFRPGAKEYDEYRESHLKARGFHILRFENRMIYESMEYVLQTIRMVLENIPSP